MMFKNRRVTKLSALAFLFKANWYIVCYVIENIHVLTATLDLMSYNLLINILTIK